MLSKLKLKLLIKKWVDDKCQDTYTDLCPLCEIPFRQNHMLACMVNHTKQKCQHSFGEIMIYFRDHKILMTLAASVRKEANATRKGKEPIDWKKKQQVLAKCRETYYGKIGFTCPICLTLFRKGGGCACGPVAILKWFDDKQQYYTLRLMIQQEIKYFIEELQKK